MPAITKIKGFSLVELSVVLTVIGATLSGALSLAIQKTEADKIEETEDIRMAKIHEAIESFLIKNQRIPCPANPEATDGDADFGTEGTPGDDGTLSTCTFTNSTTTDPVGNIYAGVVPFVALDLPPDYMFDGWDRRFSYIVDARFANNSTTNATCSTNTRCFKETETGSINLIVNEDLTIESTYILISHGKNGSGAYTYYGTSRLAASTDDDEKENAFADDDDGFDADFVAYSTGTVFDDYVDGKTKSQLMIDSNAMDDSDICQLVQDPANNICSNITDNTNCVAWATKLKSICFYPE